MSRKFIIIAVIFFMVKIINNIVNFRYNITDFSNIILSLSSKNNVDISSLIHWYYFYLLILCPILILAVGKINFKKYYPKKFSFIYNKVFGTSTKFFIFIALLLSNNLYINMKYSVNINWYISLLFVILLILIGILYKKNNEILLPKLYTTWLLVCVSCNYLYTAIYYTIFNSHSFEKVITVCYLITLVIIIYLYKWNYLTHKKILYTIYPIIIVPIMILIEVEIIYILRYKGIYIEVYLPILFTYSLMSIICFYRWNKFNNIFKGESNLYFLATIGYLCQSNLRALWISNKIDFFEGANHGIQIYDFINNIFPVLQNFDAHMLSTSIWGFLYYEVTNDKIGALFAPYAYINVILIGIFLFFILKKFIGSRNAWIVILLLPIMRVYAHTFFIGLGIGLYFIYWMKLKKYYFADIFFSLIFWFGFAYQLDIGASFSISSIICAILYLILNKRFNRLKKFILCQLAMSLVIVTIFYVITIYVNIDIMDLYSNILTLIISNQNWAYGNLGNDKVQIIVIYFFMPIVLLKLFFNELKRLKKNSSTTWILFFLYIAYILNVPRTLVRHNLIENSIIAYGLEVLIIILYYILSKKKNRAILFTMFFVIISVFMNIHSFSYATLSIINVKNEINLLSSTNSVSSYIIPRVEDENLIKDLKEFFDSNLKENETYLDFTNQTLLYAFLNRKNPVYINQSPGLINGENGQKNFLKQVKDKNITFVLMPYVGNNNYNRYADFFNLDSILNVDRYYLVIEYICRNYRPLCIIDDMVIWCKKDEYDYLVEKNNTLKNVTFVKSYDYNAEIYYNHDLGFIPFLLGTGDKNHNSYSRKICDFNNNKISKNEYLLTKNNINISEVTYMVFEIDSEYDGNCNIIIQKDDSKKEVTYNFRLVRGKKFYKIRCSSDILWYSQKNTIIKVDMGNTAQLKNFYLMLYDEGE